MKWFATAAATLLLAGQAKTTQDGVYSDAQARRGEATYAKACASCHGADLSGSGQAPALADADFIKEWTDQPISDLYDRIQATMPADAPGTLKPAEVADVMALLFARAHMPSGSTELPGDSPALKSITFSAPKP
ncbi:MAG TPA: cytochrome c [Vicinamibacterales bacterium]|nr:cytochrome c [Vicinamibacterales bacterium]